MPAMFTIGQANGSRQRLSGGCNLAGLNLGLHHAQPSAKDQEELARPCRGALADRLEIVRVKDRAGAGALLVQRKNSR